MSPLDSQIIEMPFGMGLETKQDPFQVPLGKLIAVANGVFSTPGRLSRRNGFVSLPQAALGGGNVTSPVALFGRASELLQVGGSQSLYSYNSAVSSWVNKGVIPSVLTTVQSAAQPQYSTFSIDMAQAPNGLQCFVYESIDMNAVALNHGVGYTIFDPATGQIVVPPTIIDASTTAGNVSVGNPHVICLGTTFVIYYVNGLAATSSAILGRTFDSLNPLAGWSGSATITSGTTVLALSLAAFNFDVVTDATNANAYLVFNNRSAGMALGKVTTASPLAFTASATIAAAGLTPTVFMDLNGNVIVSIDGAPVKFTVYDTTLSVVKALTSILVGGGGAAMTGVSTAAGVFTLFHSTALTTTGQSISRVVVSGVNYATIVNANPFILHVGIAAKAFAISGAAYLPAWFCFNTASGGLQRFNTPQNAIYLLSATGRVMSKALVGTNGGYETISFFNFATPSYQLGATLLSGSTATFAASNTNELIGEVQNSRSGETVTPGASPLLLNYNYGASSVSMEFGDTGSSYQRAQLANEVHTNGGVLQMYDGQNVVEHGFLVYPAFVSVTLGAGGALGAGSYAVCATYEWMDGQGQVHRSTPSTPVTFTATLNQAATYTVPSLSLTNKTGVVVQFYRTLVNGSIFFQVSNFNAQGSLYNVPTNATTGWVDTQGDVAISGNPQLYTTGGVLDNDPCPPAGAMTTHRNRLFVVDTTNPLQIWPSKQVVTPAPVEFSAFLILNVTADGGPITALASLDDKLIAFKAGRIYMFLGQGPDALGNQNDFTDAILVTSDTGCSVPKSIILTNDGLMFQSPKGLYRLSRSLQAIYIGAPVQGIIDSNNISHEVTSGAIMSGTNQIRFGVNKGSGEPGLVIYDYLVDQWGTSVIDSGTNLTNPNFLDSIDATVVNGSYYTLLNYATWSRPDLGVVEEADGSITDPNAAVPLLSFTTGWIKLSGLQKFQRARKLLLLGTLSGSPNSITVSIAYDYESAPTQTTAVTMASSADLTFQVSIGLVRQKCQALQITVQDVGGNLASVSGLALEVGMKKGLGLPATKSFG